MIIAAIDVGSPKNTGWYSSSGHSDCGDVEGLLKIVCNELVNSRQVSLGFEAPLWVPRAREFSRMTANRGGVESLHGRPWSAGAGCGSLTSGVANAAYFFEAIHSRVGSVECTTQPLRFQNGNASLFVWEAFVSGRLKSKSHDGDAQLAVEAFVKNWPDTTTCIDLEKSVNIVASVILATGHNIDIDEIGVPGIVYSA